MSEFDLIRSYFSDIGPRRSDAPLGVGDDCALLEVPPGHSLAVSIDTLAAGTHFFADCDPERLGHKCLAVGLSDLAAMGAAPAWSTLALTLPAVDIAWIQGFCRGFSTLSAEHGIRLVGGDTTRGPLSITVQVHGLVPVGRAIRRSGARPGDLVCVSGSLGGAGLALRQLVAGGPVDAALRRRLERPEPRVGLGQALRGLASAMIDLSDGLAGDLGHILSASGVGAEIELAALPLSDQVAAVVASQDDWSLPLSSGDDYELCFCVPPGGLDEALDAAERLGCPASVVGAIREAPGASYRTPDGRRLGQDLGGYDHFAGRA